MSAWQRSRVYCHTCPPRKNGGRDIIVDTPTIDVVYMPDERAYAWWTCPTCETVGHVQIPAEAQHDICGQLEDGGARIIDWSELDHPAGGDQ